MDDLTGTISQILNDPQKIEQLRAVAESLGINTGQPPSGDGASPPPSGNNTGGGMPNFDPGVLASIMQNFQSGSNGNSGGSSSGTDGGGGTSSQNSSGGAMGAGTLASLADIMKTFNGNDKNVDLLRSLKPHFSDGRAGRIDDAVRIMQIIRTWPKIRESGLLGSLGSLLGGGGR